MEIDVIGARLRSHANKTIKPPNCQSLERLAIPSPVRLLDGIGQRAALWVKDDSRVHTIYGGNKCRKLAHILRRTVSRGKNGVVTFGAAGSHHVLATGLFARECGLSARAFLIPQPWSAHAHSVLQASVNCGMELLPAVLSWPAISAASNSCLPSRDIIAPGGSNVCGSMGYLEAALELAAQVRSGALPEPDIIVVAFGSAGTAAGLWAGVEHAGLKSTIVAVSVVGIRGRLLYARWLANALLKSVGSAASLRTSRLVAYSDWLGNGYGFETAPARTASSIGAAFDLPLDPTYTAKAFAGALALVIGNRTGSIDAIPWPTQSLPVRNVLYWHTLSATNTQPISEDATGIPKKIRSLLR